MPAEIIWPERYLPGTTDNYVSNEVIVAGLSAAGVWPLLGDTRAWPAYYDNVSDIAVPGDILKRGLRFSFATFDFPPLQAEVLEAEPPEGGRAGRLGWTAWQEGDEHTALDVYHAWIVEDLPGGRVRVLTQESQIGEPAAGLATQRPTPMMDGHQDWLDGLTRAPRSGTERR